MASPNVGSESIRRELLDHVVVFNERHLLRLVRDYIAYYHDDRTHLGLAKATPSNRASLTRPEGDAVVIVLSRLGGHHHRYEWAARRSVGPAPPVRRSRVRDACLRRHIRSQRRRSRLHAAFDRTRQPAGLRRSRWPRAPIQPVWGSGFRRGMRMELWRTTTRLCADPATQQPGRASASYTALEYTRAIAQLATP
jgi:hypothetical protein